MTHLDPIYTLTAAAARVGVAPNTMTKWCNRGLIAFERMPTGRRVVRESVLKTIASYRPDPPATESTDAA